MAALIFGHSLDECDETPETTLPRMQLSHRVILLLHISREIMNF